MAPQPQQQVVAAPSRLEAQPAHLLGAEPGHPMGLHQLGQAGHDVTGVVQEPLLGVQRQVGQELDGRHQDRAVAGVG